VIPAAIDRLTRLGLLGRFIAMALLLSAALVIAAPIGAIRLGDGAWFAAVAAALTVFVISGLGTLIAELARQAMQPALATVGATMLRMGLALIACATVHFSRGALAASGYVYFVLAFYLIVLPMETVLEVSRAAPHNPKTPTAA
jgi:hypothetical protein